MAIDLQYFINGRPAGTPKNASEIKLISNWTDATLEDKSEAEVSTNTLQFVLEDAEKINNHVLGGLSGQGGIFEGLPYKINYKNIISGATGNLLDGYIDLTDEALFISCDEVEANIKKNRNLDWLTEQADSFSFAYLRYLPATADGSIQDSDYIPIKYILNYRPDAVTVMIATTSLTIISLELWGLYRDFAADIGSFNYVGIVANAIYAGIMIALIFDLIEELFEQFLPPVRYYKGMYLKTMFERGCKYLGFDFKSTIFDEQKWKDLRYMPVKSSIGSDSISLNPAALEYGSPNASSAIYNFGDFLRTMKQMFNAQIKIEGTDLRFERKDYWDSKASYKMPDVETDQDRRLSSFRYNTNELSSNYMISFQTDPVDENTLDNFEGTNYQAIISPSATPQKIEHVNIKGLDEVRLPFALSTIKDGLTPIEEVLGFVAAGFDSLTAAGSTLFGTQTYTNFYGKLSGRDGALLLSQDATGVDKLIPTDYANNSNNFLGQAVNNLFNNLGNVVNQIGNVIVNTFNNTNIPLQTIKEQSALPLDKLRAKDLWVHYHCINSFAPQTIDFRESEKQSAWITTNNQGKIYEGVEIPFCEQDWLNLQNNNRFNTADGKVGEIFRIEWDIQNERAIVDYKVKETYTNNLKIEYNDGE